MLTLRPGERYHFSLEGGVALSAVVSAVNDRQVELAPPDVVPWGATLRVPLKSVYAAERVWQARPRVVDPSAPAWTSDVPWLVWKAGTEPEVKPKRKRKAKCKPLLPDAVEPISGEKE